MNPITTLSLLSALIATTAQSATINTQCESGEYADVAKAIQCTVNYEGYWIAEDNAHEPRGFEIGKSRACPITQSRYSVSAKIEIPGLVKFSIASIIGGGAHIRIFGEQIIGTFTTRTTQLPMGDSWAADLKQTIAVPGEDNSFADGVSIDCTVIANPFRKDPRPSNPRDDD